MISTGKPASAWTLPDRLKLRAPLLCRTYYAEAIDDFFQHSAPSPRRQGARWPPVTLRLPTRSRAPQAAAVATQKKCRENRPLYEPSGISRLVSNECSLFHMRSSRAIEAIGTQRPTASLTTG